MFVTHLKSLGSRTTVRLNAKSRLGFTLVQLLVVLGLIAILAAISVPNFRRAHANSLRAQCDVKMKAIALAIDAFRQENNAMPRDLNELVLRGYLPSTDALHCPADPDPYGTYDKFFVVRAKNDSRDLPFLVCPFHEASTGHGGQARLGNFTTQFGTRPAVLTSANNVSIMRPGVENAEVGYPGMELRGGDRVITGASGAALITFADSSTAELSGGTDATVLESFVDEHTSSPLYTIIKQISGEATYTVNHGSRFDVTTPAATAGARGTKFVITVKGNTLADTELNVIEGKVVFTTPLKSGLAPIGQLLNALDVGGLLNFVFGK